MQKSDLEAGAKRFAKLIIAISFLVVASGIVLIILAVNNNIGVPFWVLYVGIAMIFIGLASAIIFMLGHAALNFTRKLTQERYASIDENSTLGQLNMLLESEGKEIFFSSQDGKDVKTFEWSEKIGHITTNFHVKFQNGRMIKKSQEEIKDPPTGFYVQ